MSLRSAFKLSGSILPVIDSSFDCPRSHITFRSLWGGGSVKVTERSFIWTVAFFFFSCGPVGSGFWVWVSGGFGLVFIDSNYGVIVSLFAVYC